MKIKTISTAILFCLLFVGILLIVFQITLHLSPQLERFVTGFSGTAIALFVTWLFLKFQKKNFKDIGLQWETKTLQRFFKGFALGLLIAGLMIGGLVLSTDLGLTIVENHNMYSFLFWTLALVPLAFMEEVVFRGLPLIILGKTIGIRLSLFIMAILFAFYHFDSNSLSSMLLGPGIWGIVYGIAAIWSDGISFPTGIHYAANLTLAAIGTKKEYIGVFELAYEQEINPEILQHTETVSIAIQIVLLIVALLLVEWYLRTRKQSKNVIY